MLKSGILEGVKDISLSQLNVARQKFNKKISNAQKFQDKHFDKKNKKKNKGSTLF